MQKGGDRAGGRGGRPLRLLRAPLPKPLLTGGMSQGQEHPAEALGGSEIHRPLGWLGWAKCPARPGEPGRPGGLHREPRPASGPSTWSALAGLATEALRPAGPPGGDRRSAEESNQVPRHLGSLQRG